MDNPLKLLESEHLFYDALKNGINLFCGAGFSVESYSANSSKKLPIGEGLLSELKDQFDSVRAYFNLSRACTKLENTDKKAFHSFLEQRFEVGEYDPLYLELLRIDIKSIYTVNIDDLFYKIYDSSKELHYLFDKSVKGEIYNDKYAVDYYPLHGSVRTKNGYVFGATDIARAFSMRGMENNWKNLAKSASKEPILFWGWNFEDAGPIEAMFGDNKISQNISRWVLLRNPDEETKDFLKSLGFNLIIGDTKQMLCFLRDFNQRNNPSVLSQNDSMVESINIDFSDYLVPKNDAKLASYPLESFFIDYMPRWSHIYSGEIHKTINYKTVANEIASGCNVIVYGLRGCGKTTLMRQLLIGYKMKKPSHHIVAPSVEQAGVYIKLIGMCKSLLFVDDCFRDTNALIELMSKDNIQVVGFDRDFNYERQYHSIKNLQFKSLDITYISAEDAQNIIMSVKRPDFFNAKPKMKEFERDPTIPTLLGVQLKRRNFKFLDDFYKKDPLATEVFLLVCYVCSCGTPCSFDMVYSYLGDESYTWEEMMDAVKRAGGLIKDYADAFGSFTIIDSLQDYYGCRTRFFAETIINSITTTSMDLMKLFSKVLKEFALYVRTGKICDYDRFRRYGYDANFSLKAFSGVEDGEEYYEICLENDDSEYIYQQAAIYLWKKGHAKKAFNWIDKARNIARYNRFSIDSTYALIHFDVNLNADDESQALISLHTLSNCCENDKRRHIHFLNFARCVERFHEKYDNENSLKYVEKAISFINDGIADTNLSLSINNKSALRDHKRKLERFLLIPK